MTDVDMKTGIPKGLLREQRREAVTNNAVQAGLAMQQALESDNGKAIIDTVQKALETRINVLISGDPESRAYVNILATIGQVIDQGKAAAERRAKEHLK